jgi:PAS domain-containing protein
MTLAAPTPAMQKRRISNKSATGIATVSTPGSNAKQQPRHVAAAHYSPVPRAIAPGDDLAALTLDERGVILDCSHGAEALFKYRRSELVWRHVSMLLPQLAELDLMPNGQPNPRLRFLCRIGRHVQAMTRDGDRFASDLFFNVLDGTAHGRLSLIVRPAEDTASDYPRQGAAK